MNIELRGSVWYATLLVPKELRETMGVTRFKRALGTSNRRDAILKAAPFIAQWKAQIQQARGVKGAVKTAAMQWRDALRVEDEDEKEAVASLLSDTAEAIEAEKGPKAAKEFYEIATGVRTPAAEYFDAWSAQLVVAPKTKDQMLKDVRLLVDKFESLESVNKGAVRRWTDDLRLEGKGDSSLKRMLSFSRNFWKYLKKYDAIPKESEPFSGVLDAPRKKKVAPAAKPNAPYQATQVVELWEAAFSRDGGKDQVLADLIMLGAYTGARIEELCSLKVADVLATSLRIVDSKTQAGIREVPIHASIAETVSRLKRESLDGYVLPGLTFNKYGDRSNAIGKRFGRLKESLGHGAEHTFHSFRSTVITQLENAGVLENTAADIVGHEKPRITYGTYSGGSELQMKADALAKVSYPFG